MKNKFLFALSSLFIFSLCIFDARNAEAVTITKIDGTLNQIGNYYYQNELAGKKIEWRYELDKKSNSVSSKAVVYYTPDSQTFKLNKTKSDLIYVGENEFTNSTEVEQTNITTNFSKEVTSTASTSTTKGFSINGEGLGFKLPIFIGTNKMTGSFNSSTTDTQTEATTETITSGAQSVKVPAHKTYRVVVSLEQIEFEGTVDYTATGKDLQNNINATGWWLDIAGRPYTKHFDLSYSIGSEWNSLNAQQKNSIKEIQINSNNNTMTVDGQAEIRGVTGTRMVVKTYDITNGQNFLLNQKFL